MSQYVITFCRIYFFQIPIARVMTGVKCRCDSKPCFGGCPCFKAGSLCHDECHGGKPWESVPCLNTEHGLKVKPLKPAEVRQALCDAGLSPIGDKNELLKRLAVHYKSMAGKISIYFASVMLINYQSNRHHHLAF